MEYAIAFSKTKRDTGTVEDLGEARRQPAVVAPDKLAFEDGWRGVSGLEDEA